MIDFSTAQVRCSSIYRIMAGYDAKTPLQKWEELAAEVAEREVKLFNMKKKDGPGFAKSSEILERLQNCLKVLEIVKNEPIPLSPGAKSYCSELYADLKYGKWNPVKDIGNKYTSKGKKAEESSINLISELDGVVYEKNEIGLYNDYLRGTPDIVIGKFYNAEKIIDVKSPWDCETFFSNLNGGLIQQYLFQMQGYMAITNAPVAEVHFCLVNLPDFMWESERMRLFKRMEVVTEESPEFKRAEEQLFNNLNFDDMPPSERRIKFTVERDDELIQKIYQQVEKVRPYIAEIEKRHLYGVDFVASSEIS